MPQTVNGVGTHYYGRKNASNRIGTCAHCHAHGQLNSYTTRLWFVIVFIPIIPLKRVRVLDECLRCHRHWTANPEQYEEARRTSATEVLKTFRDQPTVENALSAHGSLLTFHMYKEAESFRQSAMQQLSGDAQLCADIGMQLEQMGRSTEAIPAFEKAFELNPDLPEVRHSLARRRMQDGDLEAAWNLLDFLRQPGAAAKFNLHLLQTLAGACQRANDHERTLDLCQHLLNEQPVLANNYQFRKLVKTSEKVTHRTPSILPEKPFSPVDLFSSKSGAYPSWVRGALFASICSILLVVGLVAMNEYYRTHRTLYVINSFAQPVKVSIDDAAPVEVVGRKSFAISEGTHRLSMAGPVNRQEVIQLQSGYLLRWTFRPAWIFNVERLTNVSKTLVKYSDPPQPSATEWLSDSELVYIPHVDYLFEQPPQQMKVDRRNQVIHKVHVDADAGDPTAIFVGLRQRGELAVALTYAEGYLNQTPNAAQLLQLYTASDDSPEEHQRVVDFLKAGLWRTPISISWHRAYQSLKEVIADRESLAAEYDERLRDDPDNGALLYLRGRSGSNRAEQMKFIRLAEKNGPGLGWPAYALAYDAANRGDWVAAKEYCDKCVMELHRDPSFRALFHLVKLANGEAASLEEGYRRELLGANYYDVVNSAVMLIDALASQQKFDDASRSIQLWLAKASGGTPAPEMQSFFNSILFYLCGNVDAFQKSQTQPAGKRNQSFDFQFLLALDQPDAALKLEGAKKLLEDWQALMALSLSYSLVGNQGDAENWLSRACDAMQSTNRDGKFAASLLQGQRPPTTDDLDEVSLRGTEVPLFLATLARRFPDQKTQLNERASRINVSRMPPYLLVKNAIERP